MVETDSSGNQLSGSFPDGPEYDAFVRRRNLTGRMALTLFMAATLVGIIALSALLITVIDDSFGYVAFQNKIDEDDLIRQYYKEMMLAAKPVLSSEDDEVLAEGIASRPTAVGFFGYAYYQEHADTLRLLAVDGVEPNAESVHANQYLLARPLLIYTTQELMRQKPQVAAFVYYYLNHVNEVIGDVGYFPMSQEALEQGLDTWQRATGLTPTTVEDLMPVTGDITTAGSSTVAPLTLRLAQDFEAEGYQGVVTVDSIGTDAGFRQFCLEAEGTDIANASRQMNPLDVSLCRAHYREPLEFQVGADGISVVVSGENEYASALTTEQLRKVFTTAKKWSEIDPAWPDKPILRYIPGADSGTLDFFVSGVFGTELEALPAEELVAILAANVTPGRLKALDAERPLSAREAKELVTLVRNEVVRPTIVKSWSLFDSLLHRTEIQAEVAQIPNAELVFYSWVNADFVTSPQSSQPEKAGIRTAILGSIWVTLLAMIVALPIGVAAAIYLEEYGSGSWLDRLIETNINNLAGVPSIIYGMLGLGIFVRALEGLTSGTLFGASDPTTANGRTIISAALTLALLVLPLIIINGREAIRAVPRAFREASFGLGATRWQTVWSHVLPNALPGILTGTILAVGRVLGETAPLIVVGVSTYIVVDPSGPFSKFTTLPAQIYQWTSRPQPEFVHLAAAAIVVLLVLFLLLNATAIVLRNRFARRY